MSYTQEQLKGMSDTEVELRVSHILGLAWLGQRHYCTDWSLTGPLMVEYGISLIFEPDEDGNVVVVEHKPSGIWSDNPSPLRSVCEVILMMGKA